MQNLPDLNTLSEKQKLRVIAWLLAYECSGTKYNVDSLVEESCQIFEYLIQDNTISPVENQVQKTNKEVITNRPLPENTFLIEFEGVKNIPVRTINANEIEIHKDGLKSIWKKNKRQQNIKWTKGRRNEERS